MIAQLAGLVVALYAIALWLAAASLTIALAVVLGLTTPLWYPTYLVVRHARR